MGLEKEDTYESDDSGEFGIDEVIEAIAAAEEEDGQLAPGRESNPIEINNLRISESHSQATLSDDTGHTIPVPKGPSRDT